jgi:hypothetical protein
VISVKKHYRLLIAAVICFILVFAGILISLAIQSNRTELAFQVKDSVSGGWVWDVEAVLQDKVINGFYQSDQGLITYTFTNLTPGTAQLTIDAPYYQPQTLDVSLKRGKNKLEEPIALVGLEIPDLANFLAFENPLVNGWEITIRPVSQDNKAILDHPALDIWVGVRVSTWSAELTQSFEVLQTRQVVYNGPLAWLWDSFPETQFRYQGYLPYADLLPLPTQSYVMEYLVVVPDPLRITKEEFATITSQIEVLPLDDIESFLETFQGRISVFTDISWDVRR